LICAAFGLNDPSSALQATAQARASLFYVVTKIIISELISSITPFGTIAS